MTLVADAPGQLKVREALRVGWPATLAGGDAVIVREDAPAGPRFVVHGQRGPQFTFPTYAEAEALMRAYAGQAGAHVWYQNGRSVHLVVGHPPPRGAGSPGRGGGHAQP